jgi:putative membrane protein
MRVIAVALAAAVLPGLALAQIGNPGFMAPDTRFETPGVPAPNQRNAADTLFAQLAAEGGKAEVAFGELAAEKAQADSVSEFANRMAKDHSAANEDLAAIAEKGKIPLPDELNAEHQAMLERLRGLEPAAFDLAYMRGQVVDHQKTVVLLTWEINAGQDAELQRFASAKLPTILGHLHMAQGIVDKLSRAQVAEAARN